MCLYPTIIKNRRYSEYSQKNKNRGYVPAVKDERTKLIPVGCGDCIECRKQKARGWQLRLLEDIKTNTNGKFITLTFSNEKLAELIQDMREEGIEADGYELDTAIAIKAMRRFNERWRKNTGKALRHWMITELGHEGTENIHLHGIIWTDRSYEEIKNAWQYGFIWAGKYVNGSTVNYVIKYVTKKDEQHKLYRSRILTSPGIGANYLTKGDWKMNKYKGEETNQTYKTSTGHKIAMPTYWRNKIYTDEERESLWIQMLDKQQRWVCGEKVCIKHGEEDYYRILEFHRKRNKRLGYGDGTKDWNREKYERERRAIMQKQRLTTNVRQAALRNNAIPAKHNRP